MNHDPRPLLRQQRLAFAQDDFWEKLPAEVHLQCQEHVRRMLMMAMAHDGEERSGHDEREDSI